MWYTVGMVHKPDYMHCALCGKPFPILNAMTVSSITHPGFFEHFPNCEYYITDDEGAEYESFDDGLNAWEDEGGSYDTGT